METSVFVVFSVLVILCGASTLVVLLFLFKTHASPRHPLFALLLFADFLCASVLIGYESFSLLSVGKVIGELTAIEGLIYGAILNRGVVLLYNMAMIGFVSQRIACILFPLSPSIQTRLVRIIVPAIFLVPSLHMTYDASIILLGFGEIPLKLPKGCWDSRCALKVAPFHKLSFIALNIVLLVCNIVFAFVFLVLLRVKAQHLLQSFKLANSFLKYQLCSHILLVLLPLFIDFFLTSAFAIRITEILGPYVLLISSLDGLLCALIYFVLSFRKRVAMEVPTITARAEAARC